MKIKGFNKTRKWYFRLRWFSGIVAPPLLHIIHYVCINMHDLALWILFWGGFTHFSLVILF